MISEEGHVAGLLRELITTVTRSDDLNERFEHIEKYVHSQIFNKVFYDPNRKETIDKINGLADKYIFHGFIRQSEDLKSFSNKFLDAAHTKEETDTRVSIVQLLLELSENPTTKFIERPDFMERMHNVEEPTVDWASILNDTKYVIKKTFSDTSSDWSETVSSESVSVVDIPVPDVVQVKPDDLEVVDRSDIIKELQSTIQNGWWKEDNIRMLPASDLDNARFTLDWQKYMVSETNGLAQPFKIVSEYKVVREVLWQFFMPHTGIAYTYKHKTWLPNADIAFSSVRPMMLWQFIKYFEYLRMFEEFEDTLEFSYRDYKTPDTFRCYYQGISEILKPVYDKILTLESVACRQEKICTLLTVRSDVHKAFKDVEVIHKMHLEVIRNDSSYENSTHLLTKLYHLLTNYSVSVPLQNIYLTMYLHSLYKYFSIIDQFLEQGILRDPNEEFVIADQYNKPHDCAPRYQDRRLDDKSKVYLENWKGAFELRELNQMIKRDTMFEIICKLVLHLGSNMNLLRLLKKLHLVTEQCGYYEDSLYDEFVELVLTKAEFFGTKDELKIKIGIESHENTVHLTDLVEPVENAVESDINSSENVSNDVVVCPEVKQSALGWDRVSSIIQEPNPFLAVVFKQYFNSKSVVNETKKENMYKRVNRTVHQLIPIKQIIEKAFVTLLHKRYGKPGIIVKNILVTDYKFREHLDLIKHLYLFENNITYPIYHKIFQEFEDSAYTKYLYLTNQLQDLMMDIYPNYYKDIRIEIPDAVKSCDSPMQACELITVNLNVKWPMSMILRTEHVKMYLPVFQLILKLKWALHALQRLNFTDIQPRGTGRTDSFASRVHKLQILRHWMINDVSSVHHYVFGHLIVTHWAEFEKNLSEADNIQSMMLCHKYFVEKIHEFCERLERYKADDYGFAKALSLVTALLQMWERLYDFDDELLEKWELDFMKCHKFLKPIINLSVLF